jgi:hypothetical protein
LRRLFEECAGTIMGTEQCFDALEEGSVAAAGAFQESSALAVWQAECLRKKLFIAARLIVHKGDTSSLRDSSRMSNLETEEFSGKNRRKRLCDVLGLRSWASPA